MRAPGRVFWPLAGALVLADCATKRAVEETIAVPGVPHQVWDDVLRFTLAYNRGAAFSTPLGPYQRWLLIAFAAAALGLLVRSYGRAARLGWAAVAGLALVAGGAAGNLVDRLASDRGVVDFIDVGVAGARFYVFNVADVGVSVGAVLLAFAVLRDRARHI